MARHSDLRFQTGKDIAARLAPLAKLTKSGTDLDKESTRVAADAVALISAGDITELSRREVYAAGRVILALATVKESGKLSGFAPALASFGKALTLFTRENDYGGAIACADAAITLAAQYNESRGSKRR